MAKIIRRLRNGRFKWLLLWVPVLGLLSIDLLYQILIVWRQSGILARAEPWYLGLAVLNQLAVYVVLVPAMQTFYAKTGIYLSGRRVFGMLAMGLAFARIVPAGEYVVWRTSLRRYSGSASATTQWQILYWAWMTCGLVAVFVVAELVTLLMFPNTHAESLVHKLRYLPVVMSLFGLTAIFTLRSQWVRGMLRKVTYDRIGSQAVLPGRIIRERRLGVAEIGALTFASLATWMLESFTLYLCLRSLGLAVPMLLTVFAFTFARLFSMLPLAPGGAGQIEAAAAVVLAAYGYPFELAFTATLLYRLAAYWPPVLLGVSAFLLTSGPKGVIAKVNPMFASQIHRRTEYHTSDYGAQAAARRMN